MASLVAMRAGTLERAGDATLVETDFARLGVSGLDVLRELLAAGSAFPIVVTFGESIGNPREHGRSTSPLVRRPRSLDGFCGAIRRMRNADDRMYLSVGV